MPRSSGEGTPELACPKKEDSQSEMMMSNVWKIK
jgi:hypothetical protein